MKLFKDHNELFELVVIPYILPHIIHDLSMDVQLSNELE